MCDTIVLVNPEGVLFAKNSDRDANEAQFPEWYPAADHDESSTVHCTYLEIPQVAHTYATLISRPFWMWGAEIGTNEHGVTIGNEAVFTKEPYAETGLTGMDLLRLALERSANRHEAISVMVGLLETHGQGGGCGFENRSFTYHNSYIVADPEGATVFETAGDKWATEDVAVGIRTISNGLTIPGFADRYRDRIRSRISACDVRTSLTAQRANRASRPQDLMAVLRSHGPSVWPDYRAVNGTLRMPCMHGGGLVASSSSTAGWVADLADQTHWITGTSAQCLGLFKPVRVEEPVDIGTHPDESPDGESLWWRHEYLARAVMRDPGTLAPLFVRDRDEIERSWRDEPPPGQDAFDLGSALLDEWLARIRSAAVARDVRPWYARRYWAKRDVAVPLR
jgi:dipeptidase